MGKQYAIRESVVAGKRLRRHVDYDVRSLEHLLEDSEPKTFDRPQRVNETPDVIDFYAAGQPVFDIHETGHGNALSESGLVILMLSRDVKTEIARPAVSSNGS